MAELESPAHLRAFVAVQLPPALLEKVGQEQRALERQLGHELIRWTRPEQVHLTLKFFGNVAAADVEPLVAALGQSVVGVHPFELRVGGLGAFGSLKQPRVIWLGLQGDLTEAQKLQHQVDEKTGAFGSHSEDRSFKPHLTLGRVKAFGPRVQELGERLSRLTIGALGSWRVEEIELVQSRLSPKGSTYMSLAKVPLLSGSATEKQ